MHRPTLGVVAGALIVAGIVGLVVGGDADSWAGIVLRAGAVLGALWLVLPAARRMPASGWWGLLAGVAVFAVRPRLILYAIVAAIGVGIGAGLVRRAANRPTP